MGGGDKYTEYRERQRGGGGEREGERKGEREREGGK